MEIRKLRNLLETYKCGRYLEDRDLPGDKAKLHFREALVTMLGKKDSLHISTFDKNGQVDSLLIFRISKWDTQHFEKMTCIIDVFLIGQDEFFIQKEKAKAALRRFDDFCVAHNVKTVFVKISSLDLPIIHALEERKYHFIESWIYNKFDLSALHLDKRSPLFLREARKTDVAYMLKYAKNAFSVQRFHADPNIAKDKAEGVYQKWIQTAFRDKAQKVLVFENNGVPAAFMIYSHADLGRYYNIKYAMWKMALINPDCRDKKLGADFLMSVLLYHKNEGLDVVDSGLSIRNLASLNLHNKIGFKIFFTQAAFHKWF